MSIPNVLADIVDHKRQEIELAQKRCVAEDWRQRALAHPRPVDFLEAIRQCDGMAVIAEIKKASPSAGVIRENFDPPAIASSYEAGGANCLSVLTDEKFFQGSLDFLKQVAAVTSLPLLRKDFILDECQIFEAKLAGASAVLLIAECLDPETLARLVSITREVELTPLVELYEPENLPSVLKSDARLIGINNRNLKTFHTDIRHTLDLLTDIPEDRTVVSESGIRTPEEVLRLAEAGVDAILVGEAFMRAQDPGRELARLLGRGT